MKKVNLLSILFYIMSILLYIISIALAIVTVKAQDIHGKISTPAGYSLPSKTDDNFQSALETGNGLKATYFNNKTLSGLPSLTRTDANIDFNWKSGSPAKSINSDGFSVHWAGQIVPKFSETYTFYTRSDDGIRLWVNDTLLIYNWEGHQLVEDSATITLIAGTKYNIITEYYDNEGLASAVLLWKSISQPKKVIPKSQLYSNGPIPVTPTTNGLKAYYFNNTSLSGTPSLIRIDPVLNFDWWFESPGDSIHNDEFSVRWVGQVKPKYSETYTFYTRSDDGIRLWVNNTLLIDNWRTHEFIEDSAKISLNAGVKYNMVIEYYEQGGLARAALCWESASQKKEAVSGTQLYTNDYVVPPEYGLTGYYFNNKTLSGTPVLTRTDPDINFDWQQGSPDSSIHSDKFSVRWVGQLIPTRSDTYTFYTQSDDGVSLWVGNTLLIDNWSNHSMMEDEASIYLSAGTKYDIVLEYYENGGMASAKLLWSSSTQAKEVVSRPYLYANGYVPKVLPKISCRGSHNLLITPGGTLWGWGRNDDGQLGDAIKEIAYSPFKIGSDSVWKQIVAGDEISMGIKTNGTLWASGYNYQGQIGDGTTVRRTSFVQIGTDTDWKLIAMGYGHTLAIKTNGTLWAWGDNQYGQLGNGTTTRSLSPIQVGNDSSWREVATGSYTSLAIKGDGTLWAWGNNGYGQIGDGSTIGKLTPVRVGKDMDWKAIKSGWFHSLALKKDGSLWAWGLNSDGELGDGTTTNTPSPEQIGTSTEWRFIETGGYHSLAIKSDSSLWTWGYNGSGQLGDGTKNNKYVPTMIPGITNCVQIAGGEYDSYILKSNNQYCGTGDLADIHISKNYTFSCNDFPLIPVVVPDPPEEPVTKISSGLTHTLLIQPDGSLWAWGSNIWGQLGGYVGSIYTPAPKLTSHDWKQIDAGTDFSIGIKRNGTLWTWGWNEYGQLGDGTYTGHGTPKQIVRDANWKQVSAGYGLCVAIKKDGTLWEWGLSLWQVGSDKDWKQISSGHDFFLALKNNGSLWAWGSNYSGQMGDGTNSNSSVPKQIGTDTIWQQISAGENFSLGLKKNGTLWAWGNNVYGQLGDGTTTNSYVPKQIGTDSDWKQVKAAYTHSLAIKTDSTFWTWGSNAYGQLGDGSTMNRYFPVQIPEMKGALQADGGQDFTVILKPGDQYCTAGSNWIGQLGDNTIIDRATFNCFPLTPTLKSTLAVVEEPVRPQFGTLKSQLQQSYPNPTQGVVTFPYMLADDALDAKIVLSNVMNGIIKEYPLYNKGKSSIEINISDLPSGIYFYGLIINGAKADSKKLLLVK